MIGTGSGITKGGYVEFDLKDATDTSSVLNLALWLKNDTGVTAAKWNDSSGNNNHATQATEVNQADVSGGGLDFESTESDHYDLTSTITIANQGGFCLAVVIDLETLDGTLLGKDAFDQFRFTSATGFRFRSDTSNVTTDFVFPSGTFTTTKTVFLLNRSSGSNNKFTFMKNGTTLTADVDTSANEAEGENPGGFDLNVVGSKSGTSQFLDGKILELAFWERALTLREITDVNDYLINAHEL